jgi:hypothetical protein
MLENIVYQNTGVLDNALMLVACISAIIILVRIFRDNAKNRR